MASWDIEELHLFAESIGVGRHFFHKDTKHAHYDVPEEKRALAIENGALEVTSKELILLLRKDTQTSINVIRRNTVNIIFRDTVSAQPMNISFDPETLARGHEILHSMHQCNCRLGVPYHEDN